MTKRFRLAPLYFVAALALACGDDTDPVEASASGTETASSTGETTVSTTVSASVSESNSGTSESDTNETSVDDTTTDAVDTDGGRCGDGEIDDDEQCDGRDLGGASCESLGVGRGVLSCAGDCTFDTSLCEDDAGDCCEANGSPSCEDVTCESIVCAADASCCDTEWTQSCADLATASCPICGELGEGDCCATNASPGCADLTCQQIVCASDPACCTNVWSQACADAAAASCAVCDGGGQGSCCEAQATPGREDVTCQQIVCASDPFCCSNEWDQLCADAADQDCVVCGGGGTGNCCAANGTPGCDDTTCQQIVCASDPFCCSTAWDQLCADQAADSCATCGGGGDGSCCVANGALFWPASRSANVACCFAIFACTAAISSPGRSMPAFHVAI